ncbi:hypothetical protein [Aeromicrobium sp.]|uniref:hypothetical protein n=1 Tax=Aeromicrobium sp. TaxID=1871063 RepID=UPI003C63496E
MHRVVLNMQMSSDEAFTTVSLALGALPDVTIDAPGWGDNRHLIVTIDSDDPDVVDIVREITWQFDALAIQLSLHLADAG